MRAGSGIALAAFLTVLAACGPGINSTAPASEAFSSRSSASPTKPSTVSDAEIAIELRTVGVSITRYTNIAQEDFDEITPALFDRLKRSLDEVGLAIDDWHSFADALTDSELAVPGRLNAIGDFTRALDAWHSQQRTGADIWEKCLQERDIKPHPLGIEGCIFMDFDFAKEQRVFSEYVDKLRALAADVGLQ